MSVSNETLEALYNINKHAQRYAELGTKNYYNNKKASAKANSIKKSALYGLKNDVLHKIQNEAVDVSLHIINERKYYCLYFKEENEWSFHTPVDEFHLSNKYDVGDVETLDDFNKTSKKEFSNKSLKDSLLFLEKELELNANNYLTKKFVNYGSQSYFIGWKYLGE